MICRYYYLHIIWCSSIELLCIIITVLLVLQARPYAFLGKIKVCSNSVHYDNSDWASRVKQFCYALLLSQRQQFCIYIDTVTRIMHYYTVSFFGLLNCLREVLAVSRPQLNCIKTQ